MSSPTPREVNGDNFQQELWRYLQTWSRPPGARRNVWVAYGDKDYLIPALPLIAPLLPQQQLLQPRGGHDWETWSPVTRDQKRFHGGVRCRKRRRKR